MKASTFIGLCMRRCCKNNSHLLPSDLPLNNKNLVISKASAFLKGLHYCRFFIILTCLYYCNAYALAVLLLELYEQNRIKNTTDESNMKRARDCRETRFF